MCSLGAFHINPKTQKFQVPSRQFSYNDELKSLLQFGNVGRAQPTPMSKTKMVVWLIKQV